MGNYPKVVGCGLGMAKSLLKSLQQLPVSEVWVLAGHILGSLGHQICGQMMRSF